MQYNILEKKIVLYIDMLIRNLTKRMFRPDKNVVKITDINLEDIKKLKDQYGIAGIILDMDGTIKYPSNKIIDNFDKWIGMIKSEIKICIVSNAMENLVEETSKKYDLDYISFAMKPARKAFLEAANKMGLDPENIIVIGDSPSFDVLGAKRCGMKTILVNSLNSKELEER